MWTSLLKFRMVLGGSYEREGCKGLNFQLVTMNCWRAIKSGSSVVQGRAVGESGGRSLRGKDNSDSG